MTEIKEQNRFLPPMRMHPAYRHGDMTPWGGEQLKTVFGKDIPDERTGEALEMSVIPGLESTDDDGVTLTALIERYGSRLTGLPEGTEFPLLLKLLVIVGRELTEDLTDSKTRPLFDRHRDAIKGAINYIEEHFTENLTIDSVAKMFMLSPSFFGYLFKNLTSKTFTEYLKNLRIAKAAEMLKTSDKKVI